MRVQTASQPAWRTHDHQATAKLTPQPSYESLAAPLTPEPLARANEIYSVSRSVQDFSHTDLSGRNYSNRNFAHAIFYKAKLCHVNFSGTDLRGADLKGADLQGANLQGADLSGADLRGANLTGVDLQGVNLTGALYDESTQFSSQPPSPLRRATRLADRRTPALSRSSSHFANPQPFPLPMSASGTPTRSRFNPALQRPKPEVAQRTADDSNRKPASTTAQVGPPTAPPLPKPQGNPISVQELIRSTMPLPETVPPKSNRLYWLGWLAVGLPLLFMLWGGNGLGVTIGALLGLVGTWLNAQLYRTKLHGAIKYSLMTIIFTATGIVFWMMSDLFW